jgi:hypothetical protein
MQAIFPANDFTGISDAIEDLVFTRRHSPLAEFAVDNNQRALNIIIIIIIIIIIYDVPSPFGANIHR